MTTVLAANYQILFRRRGVRSLAKLALSFVGSQGRSFYSKESTIPENKRRGELKELLRGRAGKNQNCPHFLETSQIIQASGK